ncbi:hypothetical protein [Nonomuraea gerenzanensis]|uniref:hypothetical protein n=1 Tax=Nonomuraea gerenzanensis TaxID=93944 RepID=UPI001CD9A9FE|nr:hypothetical protein [Nonomuraea gerenzanensis]UBU12924.1 hypothetical protein LCN96_53235 [Nonomuraea gerenzanensis]
MIAEWTQILGLPLMILGLVLTAIGISIAQEGLEIDKATAYRPATTASSAATASPAMTGSPIPADTPSAEVTPKAYPSVSTEKPGTHSPDPWDAFIRANPHGNPVTDDWGEKTPEEQREIANASLLIGGGTLAAVGLIAFFTSGMSFIVRARGNHRRP